MMRRREHDLVLQRVVVRVDGLRQHAPFAAIDGLSDLARTGAAPRMLTAASTLSKYGPRAIWRSE